MRKTTHLFLMLLLIASSWMAAAHFNKSKSMPDETKAPETPEREPLSGDEQELLRLFTKVLEKLNSPDNAMQIEGRISIEDPANPQASAQAVPFRLYRDSSAFYYSNQGQLVINNKDYYLVMDSLLKRIVVAPPKKIEELETISFQQYLKNVRGEGYQVEKEESGHSSVIRLHNKAHISCKEIQLEYKTATLQPLRLCYRLTDLENPDERSDKKMEVMFDLIKSGANQKSPKVIVFMEGAISPVKGLEEYELINLINQ